MLTTVELWTDGACSGNPGPGGWAAILCVQTTDGPRRQELAGGAAETTNNRMELTAAAEGLRSLQRPCYVRLHTDSAYVMDAFVRGWIVGWKRRGWTKSSGAPVLNRDLWERLESEVARHRVEWVKVAGHGGVALNERCDQLAVAACARFGGSGRGRR